MRCLQTQIMALSVNRCTGVVVCSVPGTWYLVPGCLPMMIICLYIYKRRYSIQRNRTFSSQRHTDWCCDRRIPVLGTVVLRGSKRYLELMSVTCLIEAGRQWWAYRLAVVPDDKGGWRTARKGTKSQIPYRSYQFSSVPGTRYQVPGNGSKGRC